MSYPASERTGPSMAEADFLADASRLVAWSGQPKAVPASHEGYAALVGRYLDDPAFAATADVVAAGFGLNLTVDRTVGVIAVADADSPLRRPLRELVARSVAPARKAVLGVALLGIARVAYPTPARLEDAVTVARVSVSAVVEYLNRLSARLAETAGDPIAGEPDLAEVHRAWEEMGDARSEGRRASMGTKTGVVRKVCDLLVDSGMARKASDDEGGTYRMTPRFTLLVRSMLAESSLYADLRAAVAGTELIDPSDVDGAVEM